MLPQFKDLGELFTNGSFLEAIKWPFSKLKSANSTSKMSQKTLEKYKKIMGIGEDGLSSLTSSQIKEIGKKSGYKQSLIAETLLKASDADFLSKAKVTGLKWSDAVKDTSKLEDLKKVLLERARTEKDLLNPKQIEYLSQKGLSTEKLQKGLDGIINSSEQLGDSLIAAGDAGKSSFTSLGSVAKGFLLTLKAIAPALIAISAAAIAFNIWNDSQTQFTQKKDAANEANQQYQSAKDTLESYNSELEQTQSRIEELQKLQENGTITIAEESELETLQKQNDELERKYNIQKNIYDFEKQNAIDKTMQAASEKQTVVDKLKEENGGFWGTIKGLFSWLPTRTTENEYTNTDYVEPKSLADQYKEKYGDDTTLTGQLKTNIKILEDQKGKLVDLEEEMAKPGTKITDTMKNQQTELKESIAETSEIISSQTETLEQWIDTCSDSTDIDVIKSVDQWKKILNEVQNIGKSKLQKDVNNLNTYFSTNSGSIMKKYLEDIVTKSGNASDALTEFERVGMSLDDIGVSSDAFTDYFQDIIDGSSSASEAIEDMSDTLVGTYDNLAAAIESANASEKFDNLKTWYESVKEMYEKGDVGTDDFQTMAQFGVGYNIKKRLAGGGYEYKADAYVEAYQQAEQMLERWYGGDDEAQNTQNIIDDFVSAGLMKYNEATNDYDVIKENFQNTAQAAQALGTSIDNVEVAMGKLETKSFEFDSIDKSGEMFKDYQDYLEKIKTIRDSLNNGTLKDNLSDKISGWDTELDQFDNDLTTLTEPKVIEIKFEYDLAALQQKTQEAAELARSSGENSDWAAAIVSQKSERSLLDDKTGYTESGNDAAFKNTDSYIDKIYDNMAGKTAEERLQLNQAAYALQEFQNQFLQLRAEGSTMDWNQFIGSDQAAQTMSDVKKMTGFTLGEIKGILNSGNLDFIIGANTDQADEKVEEEKNKISREEATLILQADSEDLDNKINETFSNLKEGEKIPVFADVNGALQELQAVRDENGEITFTADVNGIPTQLTPYLDLDGNIAYTSDPSALDPIFLKLKELEKGTTIQFTANVDGVDRLVSAYKKEDGTISYTAVGADGMMHDLMLMKNQDGSISYEMIYQEEPVPKTTGVNYEREGQEAPKQNNSAGLYYKKTGQDEPSPKTVSLRYVTSYVTSGGGPRAQPMADNLKPMFNGTANASGNWGVQKSETSLVGELGPEIVVRNGRYFTVGENGAEFTDVRRGDVIFNHKQSMELLKNGYVTSGNGRAKVIGEAFASGSGGRYQKYTPLVPSDNSSKNNNSSSGSKSSSGSSSSGSSKRSSGRSSGGSSSGSSGSSSTKEATEETFDWIEVFLKEMSRATEIAVDNIDRAIGLAQKQTKAYDAISKVQQELTVNQQSANKYLQLAANVGLDPSYISKIQNGTLDVEKVTNEDLKKKIDEYKDYYSKYESAADNVAKLEDKITELAEKRLEIITDSYDAIVDINDKIKSVADSKISLNDALGVAIDNPDNYASINNSIKAQEDTYNQLTKKLSDYQKEVDSQLSSGYLKKGSEAYQAAMKNIQDFTAKIYDASTSLLELRDKLDQIKIDTIQNVIDGIKRNSDITEKYISYLQSQNRDVPENLYTDRIDNNNAQVQQNLKQMEIYRKKQAVLDVNSKSYQDYAEKIQTLKENTLELIADNESLQDSIYELRFKPLDDAIQKYSDLEDELKSFRDLLNDDAFLDKQGRITEEGLAQVALLQQSIGTAKQKIADYTTGLQKLKESYDNGVISLTEYNDKSKDYREGIQGSIADVKSYQDSLVDLYKNAMSTEVDYLDKIISKRKEALTQQKDMYDYSKKINSQNNNINSLKAQIMALESVNICRICLNAGISLELYMLQRMHEIKQNVNA